MKMALAFTGRSTIAIRWWVVFFLCISSSNVGASEARPAVQSDPAAGIRIEIPLKKKKSPPMDVAIFTELSPVIVGETPVKLPKDQNAD